MSAFDRRVDPEVREVRRLEVVNGALGRRRWSAEAKARIVAESLAPGVVISAVARRHDLRPQQLFAWRHQARQGRLVLPAEALAFVPVVTDAADAPPTSATFAGSAVVQAAAPARLIEGGLPTEALVAHVLVGKYADHLPLYRQSQILARQRIELDRSTLADWVGRAAAELRPLHERLFEYLKGAPKLFMDETRAPVLDPGRRRTKTGYLWAIARDDRPWAGPDPPAVVYLYAPGRGAEHAIRPLAGFKGILQVDAYAAYNALADPARDSGPVTLAYCWSHVRRRFYEIAQGGDAPLAEEALRRIAALFGNERMIRGQAPEQRRCVRLDQTKPLVDELRAWLETMMLAKVSGGSRIAQAIRYALKHWAGLTVFLDDGRIEIDSNVVERAIRPIALNRKNALFAGSDQGGVHWGVIASLIETCKLNAVDPEAYLADVLTRLVNRHPASQIDQLMPWAYAPANQVA